MEQFERDESVVLEVMRQIDSRHATTPELTLERIAVG
jgi:hypothetical protein